MSDYADAHVHLFSSGYVDVLPESCRRITPDELTLYESLARRAGIVQSLVIGFEGLATYRGNNEYLAEVAQSHDWVRPTAFVADPQTLTIEMLEAWKDQRFVGISLYVVDQTIEGKVRQAAPKIWDWISANHWLVSINSRDELWWLWSSVLDRFADLRLLISHLGLPPAQEHEISAKTAKELLEPVCSLSQFPGVNVKLSGFYALARPSFGYPHKPAWQYVECALEAFGPDRLLFGSDFSPSLEHVSFEQTIAIFDEMPFLSAAQRQQIRGGNLIRLLGQVRSAA